MNVASGFYGLFSHSLHDVALLHPGFHLHTTASCRMQWKYFVKTVILAGKFAGIIVFMTEKQAAENCIGEVVDRRGASVLFHDLPMSTFVRTDALEDSYSLEPGNLALDSARR